MSNSTIVARLVHIYQCKNPNDFFRLIFTLPQLKSCRFHYYNGNDIALPITTKEQHSTIETLALYTGYSLNEILTLTSYTPNLRRLIIPNGMDHNINIQRLLSIRLPNLTYLSTRFYTLNFHEFEIVIKKICSTLKILHIEFLVQDVNFLDGDCWENLILTSLPYLEELHFIYDEDFSPDDEQIYSGRLNSFNSPFWIDRRWFFEVEIDSESVNYIVRPYRWYEDVKNEALHSPIDYSKLTRLTISWCRDVDFNEIVLECIMRILTITNIYHLEIIEESVNIPLFIRLLNVLTDVETLKIHSITWDNQELDYEEFSMASSTRESSKVKKVYIENLNKIDDIFLLMALCPYMTYLKIDHINVTNDNVESILNYFIGTSYDNQRNLVRLLCFRIPAADDGTIKKLKRTIITRGIACDYTIKRIIDHVYIEWKLESTVGSS
ncbi:unnamed protein product [Rotaria sp. Silwood2]|nr:unnamed protein product [Rotaria sp. Silwood2]